MPEWLETSCLWDTKGKSRAGYYGRVDVHVFTHYASCHSSLPAETVKKKIHKGLNKPSLIF